MFERMSATEASRQYIVLLVDDDLRTSRRMADMLREDGFLVEIARDGAAAIARLARSPVPDALVTELAIAHADGTAVARFARTRRPGLPVLVLTGYPNLFDAQAFADGYPAALFTKPVDYATLRSALDEALLSANAGAAPALQADEVALDSNPDHAPRNTLPGTQTIRALRRP